MCLADVLCEGAYQCDGFVSGGERIRTPSIALRWYSEQARMGFSLRHAPIYAVRSDSKPCRFSNCTTTHWPVCLRKLSISFYTWGFSGDNFALRPPAPSAGGEVTCGFQWFVDWLPSQRYHFSIALPGCGGGGGTTNKVTSVVISPTSISLNEGGVVVGNAAGDARPTGTFRKSASRTSPGRPR